MNFASGECGMKCTCGTATQQLRSQSWRSKLTCLWPTHPPLVPGSRARSGGDSGTGRKVVRLARSPQTSCGGRSASDRDQRGQVPGKVCGGSQVSFFVTLGLTPGNSQLGELPCGAANRYSAGMCLGRPEHPCLPDGRVALPPSPCSTVGWSPFACTLAWGVGSACEARPPALPRRVGGGERGGGGPALEALRLPSLFSQEAELSRAVMWAQPTPRQPQTPAVWGKAVGPLLWLSLEMGRGREGAQGQSVSTGQLWLQG